MRNTAILVVIALTTPTLLGLEALVRALVTPPEWEAVRGELRPAMTAAAWILCALTAACVPAAFAAYRALLRRLLAKVDAFGGGEKKREEARLEAMFVATSVPQLPAALAVVALGAGGAALPAILSVGVSAVTAAAVGLHDQGSPGERS